MRPTIFKRLKIFLFYMRPNFFIIFLGGYRPKLFEGPGAPKFLKNWLTSADSAYKADHTFCNFDTSRGPLSAKNRAHGLFPLFSKNLHFFDFLMIFMIFYEI